MHGLAARGNGDTSSVPERLAAIRDRIRAVGADPATVRILAVTKGFGPDVIAAAHSAGLMEFGENYAKELLDKLPAAPRGSRWHFLGAIQANKVKRLAPHVCLWHSVDSAHQVGVLSQRAPGASVLVQVNLEAGRSRRGALEADVPGLVERARDAGLEVRGLMAVGARHATRQELGASFGRVAALAWRLGLVELSMGMSADYELAVAQGATIVRLGRALFGERPARAPVDGTDAGAPWQGAATLG
ncbi:MAG TPA: YggS family pyridoxal phosphate-dependent enzyme [Acidimicrobiales bacterium]|nr:YggS family pyridoxal phosphate-dependent enzyme [Acidimicrobiales bacterium]